MLLAVLIERRIKLSFTYQSQNIDFSEWISLITLCFAPLLAHIYVGVPRFAILSGNRPKWHDRITHLNPTSIFWRYYAITNRRVRSKAWSAADMAAANTAFWVRGKWDGSEGMVLKSKPFCTQIPEHNRISLLSESAAKTFVVTLQGAQGIWDLSAVFRHQDFSATIALPTIFSPLAIYGLLRLMAAFWLSDDTGYINVGDLDPRRECQSLISPTTLSNEYVLEIDLLSLSISQLTPCPAGKYTMK